MFSGSRATASPAKRMRRSWSALRANERQTKSPTRLLTASAARAYQTRLFDFIFGDAIALAFWINGTDSGECCAFSGGPFVESRYFGEGIGIAVRKGNDLLRQSLNWALFRLWEKGRYTDLWLRYFSISPF